MKSPGLAEVVKLVMKTFSLTKPVYFGYDSGASTGMKMCVQKSSVFDKLISFHPSYTEEKKDELNSLKTKTMI